MRTRVWIRLAATILLLGPLSCREPTPVSLDQPFELRVKETARVKGTDLLLRFDRVASDSRCPQGAQCVWAGEAVVTLNGRVAGGPPETFEVHLPGLGSDSLFWKGYDGYDVRMVRLDPYPVAGVPADSTTRRVTLVVRKR